MAITTKALQDFIDATKKQLAAFATQFTTIVGQITGLTTRLTKAEGRLTTAEGQIKMLISQSSSGAASVPASVSPSVYIVSSALASLPTPGNRVGPSDAANMPTIVSAGSPSIAVQTASGAHHYRFVGIKMKPAAGVATTGLVRVGSGETSLANLPHDIIFDRCYVPCDPTANGTHGINLNGAACSVIDSYVSDWKSDGQDAQAIICWNGAGPFKIVNNYLEASGENMMFGGADPQIAGLVPSDIEIRRNHFFKPLSWIGSSWVVKNILEFKCAQRILAEGNVFQNIWVAAQAGYLLNAKSVNQDGGGTSSIVQDLTFRKNRGINCENGLTLSGDLSEGAPALAPTRWSVEHNEVQVANVNGGDGYGVLINQGGGGIRLLTHLVYRHNTVVGIRFDQHHLEWAAVDGVVITNVDIKDNIYEGGSNGLKGRTSAEGTATLDARMTNGTVTFNAWQGRSSANYGAASGPGNTMANNFFPTTQAAIDFVNYAAANYRLNASSPLHNAASDGTDLGANIDDVDAACLHSVTGQWGAEPATYPGGSYTNAELPRTFLDTTYRPQSGATVNVNSFAALQIAVNNAQLGDTIVVDIAGSYTGTLNLPAK